MIKVAIIGNGQLYMMLKESCNKINENIEITSFSIPKINKNGQSNLEERNKYIKLLENFDIITYEIENIDSNLLKEINKKVPIFPSIKALEMAQDRLKEKTSFQNLNINTNKFFEVNNLEDLKNAPLNLGYPFIIKTRRFGYDGKGQFVIYSNEDIQKCFDILGNQQLIAEEFIKFDYEVSCIASRNSKKDIKFLPIAKNMHYKGILRVTEILELDKFIINQAKKYMKKLLEHFNYIGTLTIEFFVVDNILYANEIAPRVHNSGHFSIDGLNSSQFENHMRAILNLDLKETSKKYKFMKMYNLIGQILKSQDFNSKNIIVKDYGKELLPNRKMGHINIISNDKEEFKKLSLQVQEKIIL